jgi:hypothetical protein
MLARGQIVILENAFHETFPRVRLEPRIRRSHAVTLSQGIWNDYKIG